MSKEIEETTQLSIDWNKLAKIAERDCSVVPVAVQNADTKEVILIAYANEPALNESLATKTAVFWSTSRNELWIKGKTSGETFELLDVYVNCEQNSLVYIVRPRRGNICHTKNKNGSPRNCYYRRIVTLDGKLENIDP
ncbi:MAG: phosphoribosyl-AMP cyclohydrolase [Chitinivibrionales bacterium]|nr:phosphoribosyl-AMP cyclohydrolase [Chitinivibrionales bacterium]